MVSPRRIKGFLTITGLEREGHTVPRGSTIDRQSRNIFSSQQIFIQVFLLIIKRVENVMFFL